MKRWVKTTFFIVDENIQTDELVGKDNFLFIKKQTQDPEIIEAIKIVLNPVVLFTKNAKHFRGKLNDEKDKIVSIKKNLTRETINKFLPTFKEVLDSKTTFKQYKQLSISGSVNSMQIINSEIGTVVQEIKFT